MRIYNLKKLSIPKIAVLATGVVAALLVATVGPAPAQASPSKQADCTGCHGSGVVSGTVNAVPSTTTPVAGATYTVVVTEPVNATGEDTGYWIANSTAAGVTGTTTGVYAGNDGTMAATRTATMTAPAAAGTYYYKVWGVKGSVSNTLTDTNFALYSITVAGTPTTTPPPTTTTTTPPPTTTTTTPPPTTTTTTPPVTTAFISGLLPKSGAIGTAVTINGSNFGTTGEVMFGGVLVATSSWTDTAISFVVPDGTYGRAAAVTVSPAGDIASNSVNFRFGHVRAVK